MRRVWSGRAPEWRRSRLARGPAAVLGLAGAAAAVIVAVGSGYIYRAQCTGGDGRVQTRWSSDVPGHLIPFAGKSESGCNVHSSGRLALATIGVWSLHDGERAAAASARPRNANEIYAKIVFAAMLREKRLLNDERAQLSAARSKAVATTRVNSFLRRFEGLHRDLVRAEAASDTVTDPDLKRMIRLLARDAAIDVEASHGYVIVLGGDEARGVAKINDANSEHSRVGKQLSVLFNRFLRRYPDAEL
ncbi:MAG: hypothetical protein ACXVRJ_14625 [Gaiellaceae bacterium]